MKAADANDTESLPPLREELQLFPGPRAWDGGPTWLIHDPPAGRYIRIGWAEFEMLVRWHLQNPVLLAQSVSAETSLAIEVTDVAAFSDHLRKARLVGLPGNDTPDLVKEHHAQRRQSIFMRILKNYIFFRLPLVRPDRFLRDYVNSVSWAYTNVFLALTIVAALLGLFLATRQWDTFVGGFPYLLTGSGIASGLAALILLKLIHELGHGFTARRYGCRARRAGVAFMFFVPMLFTDLTDAWRLTSRWQRVMIGAAGILTELVVACWALLLWNFTPDGILRSIFFFWATAAWILTLLVNASPFLRFDGYYVLSDAIDQPNLHSTAFDMARWHLRRTVLGLEDPRPVRCTPSRGVFLVWFGYATWVYRLLLFLGIAYILYLLPLKVVGIGLAAVEIWWFILRPIAQELGIWWKRRGDLRMNRTLLRSIVALIALILLLVFPIKSTVHGDAVVAAEARTVVSSPSPGQILTMAATTGDLVLAGQHLVTITSPQLAYEATRLRSEVTNLDRQIEMAGRADSVLQRLNVLVAERASRTEELRSVEAAMAQLELRAPFSGRIMERVDRLVEGDWIARGQSIFVLVNDHSLEIDAFVSEQDLSRIAVGARGRLIFSSDWLPTLDVTITDIDVFSIAELPHAMLASEHGGPIASRTEPDGSIVPVSPLYKVRLATTDTVILNRMETARVILNADPDSLGGRMLRRVIGTILRETGF